MSLLPLDCTETMRSVNLPWGSDGTVMLVTLRPLRLLIALPSLRTCTDTIRCPLAWCSLNVNRRVSVHGGVVGGVTVGAAVAVAVEVVAGFVGRLDTQFFDAEPVTDPTAAVMVSEPSDVPV